MGCLNGLSENPAVKAITYAGYCLGGCLFVGVYRLSIAVSCAVRHYFNAAEAREQAKRAPKSSGFLATVGNAVDKLGNKAVAKKEEVQANAWRDEIIRGIAEVCLLGGIIYTVYDLTHEVSLLGLDELHQSQKLDEAFS